jgi:hypothetical protein
VAGFARSSETEALFPLKTKELFAQRVFVFLLRSFHLAANVVFRKVRRLPFIDFGYRVVDRRKRLFLLDRCYPFLDRRMIVLRLRSWLNLGPRRAAPVGAGSGSARRS